MIANFDPEKIKGQVRKQVMLAVVKSTEAVRAEVIRLILHSPKTGRLYLRHGIAHRASAPHEPWASDTGHAISTIKTSYDETTLTGKVTFGASYALYLEYGTQKMEARPVLRPALTNTYEFILKTISDSLSKGIEVTTTK